MAKVTIYDPSGFRDNKQVSVFRLENKTTRLGPFQHDGQIPEVLNKGCRMTGSQMDDIDDHPKVKSLLRSNSDIRFAFDSLEKAVACVKSKEVLHRHGFVVAEYRTIPLFRNENDGQVVYKMSEAVHLRDIDPLDT